MESCRKPCFKAFPCDRGCVISRLPSGTNRNDRPQGGCQDQRRRTIVQVTVRDNNVDQALRALKKKLQREGVYREMKLRRHFEKPSEKKKRERAEAVRRARKLARKRAQREGND
tara:strand:- start:4076 stop:4417 length:342 start_codon:yes stop_codon:yes gene_type:complete